MLSYRQDGRIRREIFCGRTSEEMSDAVNRRVRELGTVSELASTAGEQRFVQNGTVPKENTCENPSTIFSIQLRT
jgi:hypothetical protein